MPIPCKFGIWHLCIIMLRLPRKKKVFYIFFERTLSKKKKKLLKVLMMDERVHYFDKVLYIVILLYIFFFYIFSYSFLMPQKCSTMVSSPRSFKDRYALFFLKFYNLTSRSIGRCGGMPQRKFWKIWLRIIIFWCNFIPIQFVIGKTMYQIFGPFWILQENYRY